MAQTKICTKCRIELPTTFFSPRGEGFFSHCKACRNAANRAYCAKNRSLVNQICQVSQKKYQLKHKQKIREKRKLYRIKNKAKIAAYQRNYWQKNRSKKLHKVREGIASLSDTYVKSKLVAKTSLKCRDVPEELIKLKRVQLQITRKLKELQT